MPSFDILILTAFFLLVLVFGTHYVRTWAFNRHEAITFECSSAAFLISLLFMIRYGVTIRLLLVVVVLFAAFAANAFSQWHFYMVLQDIIKETFAKRLECFNKQGNAYDINNKLQTMASVAIMPSFSRFIEESKLFNNPGGFIGLIKSVMKRQRFQKKKYLMRECFADNVNMIGPCKPTINSFIGDQSQNESGSKHATDKLQAISDAAHADDSSPIVSGAIHANDLALGYKDEKKGLFTYDILGWGAMIFIWYILFDSYKAIAAEASTMSGSGAVVTLIVILAFTCICYVLRHFGFARYESFTYEMTCTSLITVSFFAFTGTLSNNSSSYWMWLVFGAVLILFLAASFANRSTDKGLHKQINKKFEDIIKKITPDSETNRIKRKFLNNLKIISEWAVVPFTSGELSEKILQKLMITPKLKAFHKINQEKKNIPELMEQLVDRIVPELSDKVYAEDFQVQPEKLNRTKMILDIIGIASAAIVIICIWVGVL